MDRAYSLIEVKNLDEGKRTFTGWATTPDVDRVNDTIDPLGAKFKNPLTLLHQHDSERPIGTVNFKRPTAAGIEFEAEIAVVKEPGPLKDRVDTAWGEIAAGIVRAVSIGFRTIKHAFKEDGGIDFQEIEIFELSTVSVPANASALITSFGKSMDDRTLALIKSFDPNAPAATGTIERPAKTTPGASGKSTNTVKSMKPEEKTMSGKTIAEQISAFEATRAAKAAELETIMTTTEGETLDNDAAEAADTLADEIKSIDEHLKRLRTVERVKASNAKPVDHIRTAEDGSDARDIRVPARVKTAQKLAPGIGFARLARVKALAKMDGESPRALAKELYGEDSQIYGVLQKAAVSAASTGGQTWGDQLVGDETSVFADFIEYLRPQTILGRFGAAGVPSLRRVPFRTALIGQTGGGDGYWVGEGKAKPLTSFSFSRTTLEPLKVANIAVVTQEILRDSSPSAEMIVRDSLAAALRERLDTDFIDPAKAASSGVSPASITNGVTPITASGSGTADNVRTDVQALFTAFIDANNAPTSGVFIMPATKALALSLMLNPLGQPEFPGINMNGGTFFGLPVIVSEYVPTITGGSYVALVNAQDIYLADDGGISVDMSREASLEMASDPTMTADSPTESTVVSLWQTNAVGFRAERTINWSRRRTSAVAMLSAVNWDASAA